MACLYKIYIFKNNCKIAKSIYLTVMLRVLRLTQANRRTLSQAHHLAVRAFTSLLALPASLLKKSSSIIPSASSSPVTPPCNCPVLDVGTHYPRCCCVPRLPPLAHAPSCAACRARGPVGVFGSPTSKFVFVCLAWMVCSEDTRVYTGSGGMSLLQFTAARVTDTWFAVGVTNRRERERTPSLWWKE